MVIALILQKWSWVTDVTLQCTFPWQNENLSGAGFLGVYSTLKHKEILMEHQNFPWWKTTQAIVAINSSYSVTICDHLWPSALHFKCSGWNWSGDGGFSIQFCLWQHDHLWPGRDFFFLQPWQITFSTTSWFKLLSFFIRRQLSLVIVLKTQCRAIRFRMATIKITVDKNSYDRENYWQKLLWSR